MINASIAPPILQAGRIIDAFELAFGDPLILDVDGDNEFEFPPGTKIGVRGARIMSATKVSGRRGTIKQTSGFDDMVVSIDYRIHAPFYSATLKNPLARDGFDFDVSSVVDGAGATVLLEELGRIARIYWAEEKVPVLNERLNKLGIDYLVVGNIDIPDNKTYHDQNVILSCLEDTHYDLVYFTEDSAAANDSPEANEEP